MGTVAARCASALQVQWYPAWCIVSYCAIAVFHGIKLVYWGGGEAIGCTAIVSEVL